MCIAVWYMQSNYMRCIDINTCLCTILFEDQMLCHWTLLHTGQQYCSPPPVCWCSLAPRAVACAMWGTIGIVVYCTLLWEHPHKLYCNSYATMYEFVLDLWLLSKVMSSSGLSYENFWSTTPKVLQAVHARGCFEVGFLWQSAQI